VAITQRLTETCLVRRWPGTHLQAWLIDLQIDSIGKAGNGKEEAWQKNMLRRRMRREIR
jgi:hypothetical protein